MLEHLDIRNLANTNYQFFRRLLEFMPLETLYFASLTNTEIKHFSRSRMVDFLLVERGDPSDDGYITYSEMMTRPRLTPLYHLTVHMSSHIDPVALVAKMEQQVYRTLFVYGNYHWRQVLDFLHRRMTLVKLYGRMECDTDEEADAFFRAIGEFRVEKCIVLSADWPYDTQASHVWSEFCPNIWTTYSNQLGNYYRLTGVQHEGPKLRLKVKHWEDHSSDGSTFEMPDDESIYSAGSGYEDYAESNNINIDDLSFDNDAE
uniref:F-box domain-containing protein n=1 Tax=Panagrellus redivivus TaxID=6233 RepID=A0A7E4UM76_PANRE